MKCKNCKHPIVLTTSGWSHLDSYGQPTGICLRPTYDNNGLRCCNCKKPEPKKGVSKNKK